MKKHLITIAAMTILMAQFPAYASVTCGSENAAVQASTPTTQFILHADGATTDTATGLMWMRCSLGQTWDGSTCTGTTTAYTWQQVLQVAQDTNTAGFAGHTDWRLPSKNELESIVEQRCWLPAINAAIFPNVPSSEFWSSSPAADNTDRAWVVNFNFANVYWGSMDISRRVRLVRAGQ